MKLRMAKNSPSTLNTPIDRPAPEEESPEMAAAPRRASHAQQNLLTASLAAERGVELGAGGVRLGLRDFRDPRRLAR